MVFAGVDCGATGALGLVDSLGRFLAVYDFPGDEAALVKLLADEFDLLGKPAVALVEEQAAMGQGLGAAMLKLGRNEGMWLGVLAAMEVPVMRLRPAVWMRGLVPKKTKGKAENLAIARRLFPEAPLTRQKDDGRADALLLAHVARLRFVRPN